MSFLSRLVEVEMAPRTSVDTILGVQRKPGRFQVDSIICIGAQDSFKIWWVGRNNEGRWVGRGERRNFGLLVPTR